MFETYGAFVRQAEASSLQPDDPFWRRSREDRRSGRYEGAAVVPAVR